MMHCKDGLHPQTQKIVFSPSIMYTSLRILESTLFPLKYTFRQAPESTAEPLNSRPDARHLSNGVQKTRVTHRLCIDKTRSSLVPQWHHWNYLVKQLGMWIFLVFLCYPNCLPRTSQQPINRARPGWWTHEHRAADTLQAQPCLGYCFCSCSCHSSSLCQPRSQKRSSQGASSPIASSSAQRRRPTR